MQVSSASSKKSATRPAFSSDWFSSAPVPGTRTYLSGGPAINHDTEPISNKDLGKGERIALPIALLVLAFMFGTLGGIVVFCILLPLIVTAYTPTKGVGWGVIAGASVVVFVPLFLFVFQPWIVSRSVRRRLKERGNARILEPQMVEITPEGIRRSSDSSESFNLWKAVVRIANTDAHAFIYLTSTAAFVIPSRAFVDEASFLSFLDTARRYREEARRYTDADFD